MLQFLVQRPVGVFLSFLGLFIIGIITAARLPVSLLPDTDIPEITVQVEYPNAAARTIESTITRPLRNQLLQTNHLKDIKSESQDGAATIQLTFEFGTNTHLSFIEVNEKIDQIMSRLPRDLQRPKVIKANAGDIPIFYVSVVPRENGGVNPDFIALSEWAKTTVKRRMEQLPPVAFVDLSGWVEPEIILVPKPDMLSSLGLQETDIERLLQQNSYELGSVLLQDGHYQYNVEFSSQLQSPEDLAEIYFKHDDQVLALKEIADIKVSPQNDVGRYLHNGQQGIVFAIRKQSEAQILELKTAFARLLEELRQEYPEFDFYISNDQSALLEVSIDSLRSSLLYGGIGAFLVLFLFFRQWQSPLLIGVAIPAALTVTLLGFFLAGLSINIISLSGLILGLGLMVDNSIIVIENIRQFREQGFSRIDAAVQGANEVIRPLISSALTTCSVFVPLIFLSGMAGVLFYDQAISIVLALGSSLLIAYILLPTILNQSWKKTAPSSLSAQARPVPNGGNRLFTQTVDTVLRHRIVFGASFTLFAAVGLLVSDRLPRASFPEITRAGLEINIDWNEPIRYTENQARMTACWQHFQERFPSSGIFVGDQQFLLSKQQLNSNEARAFFFGAIDRGDNTAREDVAKFIENEYPGAKVDIKLIDNLFDEIFGQEEAPYLLHLQSNTALGTPSPKELMPVISWLRANGLQASLPPQKEELIVEILRDQVLFYDVDHQALYAKLQSAFSANQIGVLKGDERQIPIRLSAADTAFRANFEAVFVQSQSGQPLPLSLFVRMHKHLDYKKITARKSGEMVTVPLFLSAGQSFEGLKSNFPKNTNLSVSYSGQAFANQALIGELLMVFAIALLLLYLILAAQFESLLQPLIVLLTVPFGLAGAVLSLYMLGQSLNLVSVIGMIVMSGIVVNDAILKVDIMNHLSKRLPIREAIHQAGVRRLRPILMTSLTSILALTPILFSGGLGAELQRPLAVSVIGGLIVGTLASLYVIPLLYSVLGNWQEKRHRLHK
ncbi:efflux RND transporter permease subunit [Phaeodactylibacter xiamenensis]|uniref:efflux RND transporter permease subunit n=1 Tax=Phaeodactylibacter xiamenensis TaxID=1524460 RepID=UPI003CCBBB82